MNLVYERTDRIMVLEKVGSILAGHPSFQGRQYCECEICRRATEVGSAARYSPRVARILAKGEGMTTSEYKYLIKRGLTQKEIEEETGVTLATRGQSDEPLTLQKYEMLKERGVKDKEIAKLHGMSDAVFYKWKRVNGVKRIVIDGLDIELYKRLKVQEVTDREIAKRFKTNAENLFCWKRQSFTKEEIQSINQTPGSYKRRKEA